MLTEREITPELEAELRRQHIIVAHSEAEVREKTRAIKDVLMTADVEASSLELILRRWKGYGTPWSVLQGMRVLDLAAGSRYSRDFFGDAWYPQFARLCALNGAEVLAIDINPQGGFDKELFTWVSADLVAVVVNGGLQSLPELQGKKFDLINSANFIGHNFCPELPNYLARHRVRMSDFEKYLADQAGELLAEGGAMYLGFRDPDNHYSQILHTRKGAEITLLP